MQHYLNENRLISKWQSGFRLGHSCESAVIKVTADLRSALDSDEITFLVLLDFSKAFDCIDHSLLLMKLRNNFSFSNTPLKILGEYLKNRLQTVETAIGSSTPSVVNCGVLQGSVLGPLLFSLFINDLPRVVSDCKVHMYADDVSILFDLCLIIIIHLLILLII